MKYQIFWGMTVLAGVIAVFTLFYLVLAKQWLYLSEVLVGIAAFCAEIWYLTQLRSKVLSLYPDDLLILRTTNYLVIVSSIVFILLTLPLFSMLMSQSGPRNPSARASVERSLLSRLDL